MYAVRFRTGPFGLSFNNRVCFSVIIRIVGHVLVYLKVSVSVVSVDIISGDCGACAARSAGGGVGHSNGRPAHRSGPVQHDASIAKGHSETHVHALVAANSGV